MCPLSHDSTPRPSSNQEESLSQKSQPTGRLVGISLMSRLVTDTGTQIFNPFLPFIAQGLNTSLVSVGWLVGLRSACGLLAPLFGALADRYGFRYLLCLALVTCSLGTLLVGLANHWLMAAIGMAIWGIGMSGFVPTLHAYLGACLPYNIRARGIGIVEYGWALAGIVGLFSAGWLITTWNWRAPFFVLSICMLVMAFTFLFLPQPRLTNQKPPCGPSRFRFSPRDFFSLGENALSAYAIMIGGALAFFAAMQIYIAHGTWLDLQYETGPAMLGTIALIFGLADLAGSVTVSLFTDPIGKRRSVLIGLVFSLMAFLLLPLLDGGLVSAVVGLSLVRLCFEFTIVSNIALLSEQVPEQRGKVMTLGAAIGVVGMILASVIGPWLYLTQGVAGLSIVSAVMTFLALLVYALFTRDRTASVS
ncbi:MAG: MFS transporter [Planctomycetota bacterium]|nr:MFS transporter [Planctomycetota bacterium]